MRPRFGLRMLFAVITGFAFYGAAYRALLEPMVVAESAGHGRVFKGSREPHYRSANGICGFLFAPLERIDYVIRPDFWDHYSDYSDT